MQQSGNADYTLIKQSALEHNLDFESIILSIIGWIFEHCSKAKIGNFQSIIGIFDSGLDRMGSLGDMITYLCLHLLVSLLTV